MKYFIATYGCQANSADSERIARRLENMGHQKVKADSSAAGLAKADLIVINACSVRQSAMDRVYSKINKMHDPRGRVKIILAGCILPSDRKKMENKVSEIWHPDEYFDPPAGGPIYSNSSKAFVHIMTGCNNFCTYCAVPYTRGRERSRPAHEIINEVKKLIKNGCKEIWLLGQNVNSYAGKFDFFPRAFIYKYINYPTANPTEKKSNFPLLLRIINSLPGKFQIKFLTSHPKDMSDELIKTIAECPKISKEIHLPLQSGDNAILKKMNRKYTISHYKNLVKKIRQEIPDAKISTDIIVGFPGETKKQFENTAKAMRDIKFSNAYIAKYSPRPGTAAFKLKDNVPSEEKKRRRKILEEILKSKN